MSNSNRERAHVSSVIRAICRERHWTQSEFAKRAGIGPDVVSAWVREKVTPSYNLLAKVAKAIGEDVDRFLPPNEPEAPAKASAPPAPAANSVKVEFHADQPGQAVLTANLPSDAAVRIAELINSVINGSKDPRA